MTQSTENKNSFFANLFCNIILPVLILKFGNKAITKYLEEGSEIAARGPVIVLLVALAIPIVYFFYDLKVNKTYNVISILGAVSIFMTGGLALLKMDGWWMVVKEGAFPMALGIIVIISAYTKKSLIEVMLYNPQIIKVDLIEAKLKASGQLDALKSHLRKCTFYLSLSFFLSAILNVALAYKIFIMDVGTYPADMSHEEVINEQVQLMIFWGYIVIAIPCTIVMVALLIYLIKGLTRLTGMKMEDIMQAGDKIKEASGEDNSQ